MIPTNRMIVEAIWREWRWLLTHTLWAVVAWTLARYLP